MTHNSNQAAPTRPSAHAQVGAAKLNSDLTLNWGGIEGFRIAGKQGIGIIAACQARGRGGLSARVDSSAGNPG